MDDPQCWFCHLQFLTLEINSLLAVGRLLFCSGTFQVTLTEPWQSNRNLLLKVRKFQNENWSRRIAQYMNEKFCRKYSGQNFSVFFVHILGNVTTSYLHSEISWPLVEQQLSELHSKVTWKVFRSLLLPCKNYIRHLCTFYWLHTAQNSVVQCSM